MSEHTESGVHVASLRLLVTIMIVLMIGTWLTVSVTHFDFGFLNIWIGLGIATVKAILVALYFMHLRWDRPFNLMVLVGSMLFVVLMMVFCMMDVGQYMGTEHKGNPKAVQTYLDANAPFAPVTSKK